MTTITLESPSTTGRLEELVDRLLAALFPPEPEPAPSLARTVHEARRLRQSGDLDGALAVFTGVDAAHATDVQLRWLYAEWLDIARRRFAGSGAMLYSPEHGKGGGPGAQWRRRTLEGRRPSWGCAGRWARQFPASACGG